VSMKWAPLSFRGGKGEGEGHSVLEGLLRAGQGRGPRGGGTLLSSQKGIDGEDLFPCKKKNKRKRAAGLRKKVVRPRNWLSLREKDFLEGRGGRPGERSHLTVGGKKNKKKGRLLSREGGGGGGDGLDNSFLPHWVLWERGFWTSLTKKRRKRKYIERNDYLSGKKRD